MFGANQIVGKKYFKDADSKYLVTSIFYTIQGEGPLAGRPSVFIRLAKCNLACSFCDTYFDSGDWMSLQEIEIAIVKIMETQFYDIDGTEIAKFIKDNVCLILTGGEPSLQNIQPLLDYFRPFFFAIQVESNGILPNVVTDLSTWLVVSPKCAEKNGKTLGYIKPHQTVLDAAECLKFVISADPESPYHTIPDWAFEWKQRDNFDIYISPMNIYNDEPQKAKQARLKNSTSLEQRSTVEEVISFWEPGLLNLEQNQANHEYAAQYCIRNGLRLNLQMHLYVGKA